MTFTLSAAAKSALDQEGSIVVTGGPGSGKTTLALLKAQRLLPTLKPGQEILFLSFSRAAVRQVLLRCNDVLSSSERKAITVMTYHAFCLNLLRSHGRLLTGTPARIIYPGPERLARAEHDGDWDEELRRLADDEGCYAFSMFAASTAGLLQRSVCVRELVSDIHPIVILDEFQDTDDSQWALVQELAKASLLITLADPDQRIFEYQDAIDPRRLEQLRSLISPSEFDLGGDNHRSPNAGVLQFADAVLSNSPPPVTGDVKVSSYYPWNRDATVHAHVLWMLSQLRKQGVASPTVAVLARSNPFVGDISAMLSAEHTYNTAALKPIEHHVVWDAQLTAAAAGVVAAILEWPQHGKTDGVAIALEAVAHFYDMKYAENPSKSAAADAKKYRGAAAAIRAGGMPRPAAAKAMLDAFSDNIGYNGDATADWLAARRVIEGNATLTEIATAARFVRMFRATGEIGGRLAAQWSEHGRYGDARTIVRRTLEVGRVVANEREPSGVLLMTIHKSKGKEFDGVVLVEGQYRGSFFDRREQHPHPASRRLLRVGITRARHRVAIVRPYDALPLYQPSAGVQE
ncbi:DNA helicase-2/ATP-dependent DNA helicase PcrA [Barrientosiimonas humi]|uniref:DNA helicase-2/ATP-dependent DNA helicase PcrA n=1 Tax=Barrientosiimonas humi TaxID=999931 RepID=A0A542XEH7_9MICO|nr:ATP-dependent helicase [Barrientosiimonas humi]TQL34225.1 DNA helicase-2/ATP-dependent DNA helicase PcrA [Barrientosiimonas humi]CAG7574217.1 ATP-dependent DNA helicase Rep [Barrientosiimonas humi]